MPNMASILKSMMGRVGRKEAKALLTPLHGTIKHLRKDLVSIKNRLAELERMADRLTKAGLVQPQRIGDEAGQTSGDVFTVRSMRNLRKRLRLPRRKFGILLGVSGQAVYNWEKKSGRLRLRHATRDAVRHLQKLTPAQAREELAAIMSSKARGRKTGKRKSGKAGQRS